MLEMTNCLAVTSHVVILPFFKKQKNKKKKQYPFQHKLVRPVVIGLFWCLLQFFLIMKQYSFFGAPPSLLDTLLSDELVD